MPASKDAVEIIAKALGLTVEEVGVMTVRQFRAVVVGARAANDQRLAAHRDVSAPEERNAMAIRTAAMNQLEAERVDPVAVVLAEALAALQSESLL